jgi:hypothetical protein
VGFIELRKRGEVIIGDIGLRNMGEESVFEENDEEVSYRRDYLLN